MLRKKLPESREQQASSLGSCLHHVVKANHDLLPEAGACLLVCAGQGGLEIPSVSPSILDI